MGTKTKRPQYEGSIFTEETVALVTARMFDVRAAVDLLRRAHETLYRADLVFYKALAAREDRRRVAFMQAWTRGCAHAVIEVLAPLVDRAAVAASAHGRLPSESIAAMEALSVSARVVSTIECAYTAPCPPDPQEAMDGWDRDLTPDASPDQIAEAARVVEHVQQRREVARLAVLVRDSKWTQSGH